MTTELLQHSLAHPIDVSEAFVALHAESPHAMWFDDHGERGRAVSYLAEGRPIARDGASWRDDLRSAHKAVRLPSPMDLHGLPLGVVLVASYELSGDTLGIESAGGGHEHLHAWVVDRVVAIDHHTSHATLWALGSAWEGELALWRDTVSDILRAPHALAPPVLPDQPELLWRDSLERYRDMIQLAQQAIRDGDAYQLCLTTQVRIDAALDPVSLHRVTRGTNPTHHQALIRLSQLKTGNQAPGDTTLVSASPETFLDVSADGLVTTRPIKGTRPRGRTPGEDQRLMAELLESDKERAENLMIVDLMRNDLSVVCDTGSVAVPELLAIESYASVHQLVSTVTGQLAKGADLVDLLDATFPAGSMTGAPKRRAVALLSQWEGAPRGWYSGTWGVWRADGSATLAMTIRTAVVGPTSLTIGVGGGITALSEVSSEIAEVGIKAMPFLRALGHSQVQYS
jgi:para-aminobenzoate synthetase component I